VIILKWFFVGTWNDQASFANVGYDEIHDIYGGAASRGLSEDSLKKLPCHMILEEIKAAQSICCTICLQVLFLL
jgi:hypothetical protein